MNPSPHYRRTLLVFRQDLRLHDHTALSMALEHSSTILPLFIQDTRAINDFGVNDPRFGFIREALETMDRELVRYGGRMHIVRGDPAEIVSRMIREHQCDAVMVNRSYSPRGQARDEKIRTVTEAAGGVFLSYRDFLMVEPGEVDVRKVFTPYSLLWKKFIAKTPERLQVQPISLSQTSWYVMPEYQEIHTVLHQPPLADWPVSIGRERLMKDWSNYDATRNIPSLDGSTKLSVFLRFGVISVREAYHVFQSSATLLNELIWREFWYHIAHHFPIVYHDAFQEKRRHIPWISDESHPHWQAFLRAETGYPLIDASIRQLTQTHWMHNRLRMVVASFLTKNLGIDWRLGERWFRRYLLDYDEAVNIGNWQWSASIGADPRPLRIFNPLLQSERFDPEGIFIHSWIPELKDVTPQQLHTLDLRGHYPPPIVDQKTSSREAQIRYRLAQ